MARFGLATLDGWGEVSPCEVAALAALLHYLDATQKGRAVRLSPPVREGALRVMAIDAATRASLEIVRGTGGGRAGSLLACIDRTLTPGGARCLEARLAAPSLDLAEIGARLDAVEATIETMRALWSPGTKAFAGQRVSLPETTCYPRPVGPLPVVVGGAGGHRGSRARSSVTSWGVSVAPARDAGSVIS